MNRKTILNALLVAPLIMLAGACQMKTPKQQSWSNPAFEGRGLGKTLVLAIADSESICLQYEELFTQYLLPHVPAGSARASENVVGKLDEERLKSMLKENQVKTLIITQVIDGTQREQVVTLGYTAAPYDHGYWGYYNYGYSLNPNMATVSSYVEYLLETNVYDVETEKLVWSGRKSVFDDRSDMDNMNIIIKNVVRDLEKRGMLK